MEDTIYLRDVIERFEELESELEGADYESLTQEQEEARTETVELAALLEECKGNGGDEKWRGDWYPVTLIRDSYFEQAMDELLEDIGDIPRDLPCYLTITVDYAALQQDYTSVDFDGVTYWVR